MSTLLVTYDLRKSGQDYSDFHKVIKSYGIWARLSESSYAVTTTDSATTVFNKLSGHMDGNDTLYVITLRSPYFGQGPKEVNSWLAGQLPAY